MLAQSSSFESLWGRLRHHKVVQWTVAYLAVAYTLLHGAEMLGGSLGWPHGWLRAFTLLLILGIPVVLTLAWYHGARGQQRVSGTEVMIIALLLAVGGAVVWRDSTDHEQASGNAAVETVSTGVSPVGRDERPSIAVLPFANRSSLQEDAFFVDGIHDDILTQLSKVSGLRVISRTSVGRFRGSDQGAREIAQQLGVTSILEGGVQRAGDRVRVSVQLIDATSDAHVWADSYDRELEVENLFAIQSEIATAVAGALKTSLTARERARVNSIPTRSLEAWQNYQLGKQRMATRNTGELAAAEQNFREAIRLDPSFALAWTALADSLALQFGYAGRSRNDSLPEAEISANRALALDPNLAEAWASAGNLATLRWDDDRGEQFLRRSIALNPNYAQAYHWLSNSLTTLGRRDEALLAAEHAVVLDPLSPTLNVILGNARRNVGQFENALAAYRQAIALNPRSAPGHSGVGDIHALALGRLDRAVPWFMAAHSLDPGNPEYSGGLAETWLALGNDEEAEKWLEQSLAAGTTAYSSVVAFTFAAANGDRGGAYKYAQSAAALNPYMVRFLRNLDIRSANYAVARDRYAKAFPRLLGETLPASFNDSEALAAVDLAHVLQHTGERARASALLDRSETYIRKVPRMGNNGYGTLDAELYALRGENSRALAALSAAQQAGVRIGWRYARDFEPNFDSIRNEPEFKAIFAEIERDMSEQRAALATRPKDAPLPGLDD